MLIKRAFYRSNTCHCSQTNNNKLQLPPPHLCQYTSCLAHSPTNTHTHTYTHTYTYNANIFPSVCSLACSWVCVMRWGWQLQIGCILQMHYSLYRQMASWRGSMEVVLLVYAGDLGQKETRWRFAVVNNEAYKLHFGYLELWLSLRG